MKQVAEIVYQIGRTSGYNDKLELLKKHKDVPGLKEILRFIYNPYCKTGISDAKLAKAMANWPVGVGAYRHDSAITWQKMIEHFQKNQTGSSHDLMLAREFIFWYETAQGPLAKELAMAIVTQNLKIGITATSLNKAYGKDFIPKTGCMLGTLFGDVGEARVSWPCIVTEKLDGIRRILIKENGVVHMYSRSGIEDTGLVEIIEEAKHLPDNFVYDGELLAEGTFKDSIALRQATNSIANSKGKKTGLTFNVFDMVPVDEFYAGQSKENALLRKIRLGATFMDESIQVIDEQWMQRIAAFGIYEELEHIAPVPILGYVRNMMEVEPIVEYIWANGGEGVMLNTALGLYEIKRSKQLLKIKHTEERILYVVDFLEGSGKYEDSMGALVCAYYNQNGIKSFVGVGSGFTDAQRQEIWDNKEAYIDRKVEVECFGESTNAQGYTSLNCPIFKRFVGDVE